LKLSEDGETCIVLDSGKPPRIQIFSSKAQLILIRYICLDEKSLPRPIAFDTDSEMRRIYLVDSFEQHIICLDLEEGSNHVDSCSGKALGKFCRELTTNSYQRNRYVRIRADGTLIVFSDGPNFMFHFWR
jgi:hypothetical protein